MTRREIAEQSGLSLSQVDRLSLLARWDGVRLDVAERFSLACGVNLARPSRHVDWLRRRPKAIWRGRSDLVLKLLTRLPR